VHRLRQPQGRHGGKRDEAAIAKPKKPERPKPLWPGGSHYREPIQLKRRCDIVEAGKGLPPLARR
jgi:hypothetical protein